MILDPWQKKILETSGNIVLRSGRQVGKTEIISRKAGDFAVKYPKKTILIIASVERQAYILFERVLNYLFLEYKSYIKKGKDRPTKHIIKLNNGSSIYCLPTGLSGYGIRGYTIDLLIADEAAFIPEEVWAAVTPMLAVTKGDIILLSTPHGKGGYFYKCFSNPSFTNFHVSSEECPRITKEFLEFQRKSMSKVQYAQEYLGEFIDELRQFFPTELIKSCMTIQRETTVSHHSVSPPSGDNFLGVDVAGMGADESVLFSVKRISKESIVEIEKEISEKTRITETIKKIKEADKRFGYKKIYIDDGGLGVGVFDTLLQDEQTKRKVIAINNSARSLDTEEKRKKKILKEDLYNNLLVLMEQGKIKLVEDEDTLLSLKSIQYEYTEGSLRIFGNYTHITEALIRAAWCMRDKTLNIWIR